MGILPFWDRDMDLEIAPWASYSLDFQPVSVTASCSKDIEDIAAFALELESELLYVRGASVGRAGSLFPESMIDPRPWGEETLGFLMILGFSNPMERLALECSEATKDVQAGIAFCGVWDRCFLKDEIKTIAFMGNDPFFDERPFLKFFAEEAGKKAQGITRTAFFAERFGYRRATISYETDDVVDLEISQLLFDFEMSATRALLGPAPQIQLDIRMSLLEAFISIEHDK